MRGSDFATGEGIVFRKLSWVFAGVLALSLCPSLFAQDSPSLGDVARQARKEKEARDKGKPSAQKVITNDELPSGAAISSIGLGSIGSSTSGGPTGSFSSPELDRLETVLQKLDSLDRASLAKLALQDKDVNFAHRPEWEQRLYDAKQTYVSRSGLIIGQLRQVVDSAKALEASRSGQGPLSQDDPRVAALQARIKQVVQAAVETGAQFQAVILEGRNLASDAASH
jgi:hypothetical protein